MQSIYSLQFNKTISFSKKRTRKLTKVKLDLIFSCFVDHKKLNPNCEHSNYIRSTFTTPTYLKMSTDSTKNEMTLEGSEIENEKKKLQR